MTNHEAVAIVEQIKGGLESQYKDIQVLEARLTKLKISYANNVKRYNDVVAQLEQYFSED